MSHLLYGHFIVYGRVQGVGFRFNTLNYARAIGITGYVRNLPNGAVEVEGEGNDAQMDALSNFLSQGPSFSHVDRVEKKIVTRVSREWRDFSIH